jgi:EmrB/QacA subfamily drug resistance transporter
MTDTTLSPSLTATTPTQLAPASAATSARSRFALPVLLAGTCLIVLDFFIVNVAMPSIQTDLHASAAAIEWTVAGYGLTFAVFLITAARLGDRLGRRLMFTAGVGVFTAASLACGIAPNPEVLVVARLVQGAGGAMISPTVLALIATLYDGAERQRAIGTYASVMGFAAAGGQLVGGVLLRLDPAGLQWRSVFLLNVPVGLVILATVRRCLPESRAERAQRVDVIGLVIATAGLTALVLPLVDGRSAGWPAWCIASLAAAPVLLVEFAWWQRRGARRGGSPLINPAWFANRDFSFGIVTQFGFWAGQASYFLVLALYLQFGRGLSALSSGLVFSILAAAYLASSMRAPALVARYGRKVIVAAALMLATGHLAMLVAVSDAGGNIAALAPGLLLAGGGMGCCLAPITAVVLSRADATQAGGISGLLSTIQQVANAAGVAVIGLLFFHAAASGTRHAVAHGFELSLVALAGLLGAVATAARQLPQAVHR